MWDGFDDWLLWREWNRPRRKGEHGCLYWLLIGWWVEMFKSMFVALFWFIRITAKLMPYVLAITVAMAAICVSVFLLPIIIAVGIAAHWIKRKK